MPAAFTVRSTPASVDASTRGIDLLAFAVAASMSLIFVLLVLPLLGTLVHDFDEAWLVLDARLVGRGQQPFADFAHHEMPLHLYLLAACGAVFGQTLFGYRMLSLLSVVATGLLLFVLVRSVVGALPALIAQAVYLFSPLHWRTLPAIPEPPMVAFSLLGAVLLFAGRRRWSAYASGVAFVCALFIKPTCLPMVGAAVLALAYGREWRRLADLAVAGIVATGVGLALVTYLTDGVFLEVLLFQVGRIGTRSVGMWSIDSGFTDLRRLSGIDTPRQLAVASFFEFFETRDLWLPIALLVASLLALPIWVLGCARSRPALRAFAVLWPASFFYVNFAGLDFVTARYFIPFLAFSAFLLAGWVWLAQRWIPPTAVAAVGAAAAVLLAIPVRPALTKNIDAWYWERLRWIAAENPGVVSFSPMLFAATGTEPGCGLVNPALTWGQFGETLLQTERARRFRFTDERVIECLRAHPGTPIVIDWAFYFFTRPGSALRAYLAGEGRGQRLFFSPDAITQWDQPLLRMSPMR